MKRTTLAAFVVIALISLDASMSVVHAKTKVKIFKVTKVSHAGKLRLRAWPGKKSRVKASLPYNAKDLVETGKSVTKKKSRWVQVTWQNKTGWVNARYLKKTGVLVLHDKDEKKPTRIIAKKDIRTDRNANSKRISKAQKIVASRMQAETEMQSPPNEYRGDRYDQSIKPVTPVHVASHVAKKMAYAPKNNGRSASKWMLSCSGSTPKNWNIKMDVAQKKLFVKVAGNQEFSVPMTYRKWAPGGQVRMEIGGGKGRNLVDATLEKTFACNNGLSKKNYSYMVNVAVNRGQLLSGCCHPVAR
jgi:uncharacterized membrane protein